MVQKNNRILPSKDRTEKKLDWKKLIVHARLFSTREYWWDVIVRSCWDVVTKFQEDLKETYHGDLLATFHLDVVGFFIWDVPVTLLERMKRRHYDVATIGWDSFLILTNNSVTIGLNFLLLSISEVISSKTISNLRFLFRLYFSVFLQRFMSFEYSIKALE